MGVGVSCDTQSTFLICLWLDLRRTLGTRTFELILALLGRFASGARLLQVPALIVLARLT